MNLFAFVFVLALAACSDQEGNPINSSKESAKAQAASEATANQEQVCFDHNVINSIIDILSNPSNTRGSDGDNGDTSGNISFGYNQLTFDGNSLEPAWSPDGQEIAFTYDDGYNVDIHVMDTEGNFLRRLTTDGFSSEPAWSANGEDIYYVSGGDIHVMDQNGLGKRALVSGSRNPSVRYRESTSFVSFLEYFAFSYQGTIQVYFKSNLSSSVNYYRLTDGDEYDYQPDINPAHVSSVDYDIVFTRRTDITDGGDTWNIYVVNQDGNEAQLTFDGVSWGPAWSPTGQYIAFASVGNDGWNIYVMEENGQNRRQLTFDGNAYQPSWHPNERRIAFTSQKNIYTVQFTSDQR